MTLQEVKENFIIDVATELFFERPVSSVTIKDIAEKAGVGEMTIYRYFGKKQNIVLAVALKLQKDIYRYFDMSNGSNGFEKLSIFYNSFLKIFVESTKHYGFIKEFDSYMLDNSDDNNLYGYESSLDSFKEKYLLAYEEGLKDGSVKKVDNIEMLYFSSTHALLELCKKLSYGGLLPQDKKIEKHQEIETLINIFLQYLKK